MISRLVVNAQVSGEGVGGRGVIFQHGGKNLDLYDEYESPGFARYF